MKLATFIKERRRHLGWTQHDVADNAVRAGFNLTAGRVSNLESGKSGEFRPTENSIATLAAGLGVPRGVILLAAGVSLRAVDEDSEWDRLVDAWVGLPPVTDHDAGTGFLLALGATSPAERDVLSQRATALIDAAEAQAVALVDEAQQRAREVIAAAAQRARTGDEIDATALSESAKTTRKQAAPRFLSPDVLGVAE